MSKALKFHNTYISLIILPLLHSVFSIQDSDKWADLTGLQVELSLYKYQMILIKKCLPEKKMKKVLNRDYVIKACIYCIIFESSNIFHAVFFYLQF